MQNSYTDSRTTESNSFDHIDTTNVLNGALHEMSPGLHPMKHPFTEYLAQLSKTRNQTPRPQQKVNSQDIPKLANESTQLFRAILMSLCHLPNGHSHAIALLKLWRSVMMLLEISLQNAYSSSDSQPEPKSLPLNTNQAANTNEEKLMMEIAGLKFRMAFQERRSKNREEKLMQEAINNMWLSSFGMGKYYSGKKPLAEEDEKPQLLNTLEELNLAVGQVESELDKQVGIMGQVASLLSSADSNFRKIQVNDHLFATQEREVQTNECWVRRRRRRRESLSLTPHASLFLCSLIYNLEFIYKLDSHLIHSFNGIHSSFFFFL